MDLRLERFAKRDSYTIGKLFVDGVFFSDTLEDRDRGLSDSMSAEQVKRVKVYGQTAIPTGRYEVVLSVSAKFAGRVWARRFEGRVPELKNVKGFSGIRIHPLNTAADSLGCIGVGRNSAKGVITRSTQFFYALMEKLLAAEARGERIFISIA